MNSSLIVQFDSKYPGKSENTATGKTIAALQDNHQRPINGTSCATDLLVVACPDSYQKSAGLAGENLSFFRATTSRLDTPQGHRPLVIYPTNEEPWEGKENQVLVPNITREQWQENFIPSWIKKTNLVPTIEKIAGPSFSRMDTLVTIGTLSQARLDWEGGPAEFDKQFADLFNEGKIPPALLKQIAINLIKFGTNYQFAHLRDRDNLDKSLQKLLGMAKYMNDQGTYDDRDERLKSLAFLNVTESNAIDIAKDMAREIYPLASYAGIQFEFKSNGLFTALRLLNEQDIRVAKGVLIENVTMDRICGYCGVIVLNASPACTSCGGPGKEFYWKAKKVVQ